MSQAFLLLFLHVSTVILHHINRFVIFGCIRTSKSKQSNLGGALQDHPSICPYGTVFYDKDQQPIILAVRAAQWSQQSLLLTELVLFLFYDFYGTYLYSYWRLLDYDSSILYWIYMLSCLTWTYPTFGIQLLYWIFSSIFRSGDIPQLFLALVPILPRIAGCWFQCVKTCFFKSKLFGEKIPLTHI